MTQQNYPSKIAFALLEEIKARLYAAYPQSLNNPTNDSAIKANFLLEVAEKYNNPANVDKLQSAKSKVDEIAKQMQSNMNKMLINNNDMADLEDKADSMKNNAVAFHKSAEDFKSMMWCRNCKLIIIIGVIVIAILLYIIIPIIINATKK